MLPSHDREGVILISLLQGHSIHLAITFRIIDLMSFSFLKPMRSRQFKNRQGLSRWMLAAGMNLNIPFHGRRGIGN